MWSSMDEAENARARLAAIVESSDDAIISKTLDGVIQSWNTGAEMLFGYTAEEVIGKSITLIIPRERYAEELEILGRLKKGLRIDHFETVRQAKNGKLVDISITVSPIRDRSGTIIGASKVARDITERRKTEKELAAMNQRLHEMVKERTQELEHARQLDRANLGRFQMMIENLPFAAVALDEVSTILQVNDNFCAMFDVPHSAGEMVGKNGYEFSKHIREKVIDLDAYMAQLTAMLERKKPMVGYEIPLKDGRVILRDYFPIIDHGMNRGQLLLFRDVTRERRVEQAKSEFMSLASHQLRTPITIIRWGMGRLEKRLKDTISPKDLAFFRQSYDAAVRMSGTINTMLQISRIEAGEMTVQKVDVDLCAFIERLADRFRPLAVSKRQTLVCACPAGTRVRTDPDLLEQLADNLLSNAVKYTPEKGSVRAEVRPRGDRMEIRVSDTGYGIPKRQHQEIFRKFFRGDNIVTRDTKGTGLGLYMSALIAVLLGGDIDFTSEENKGTAFTVSLPQ
jgi:PAS domain S-box-containing protein